MNQIKERFDATGICTLTLARAEKHNALSQQMIFEMHKAASRIAANSAIRVVLLKGEGVSFCAGADLAWMRQQMTASDAERRGSALELAAMLNRWYRLPKPVIGQVHGNVFGGGVGLTAVCDVVLAADSTVFALSETRLGLIPATISPYVVAKIGAANAAPLFMSGRRIDAQSAAKIGLATKVVEPKNLQAEARAEALTYLESSPAAIAAAKALSQAMTTPINDECIKWTTEQLVKQWSQPDAHEGVAAFFEQRSPVWSHLSRAEKRNQK